LNSYKNAILTVCLNANSKQSNQACSGVAPQSGTQAKKNKLGTLFFLYNDRGCPVIENGRGGATPALPQKS